MSRERWEITLREFLDHVESQRGLQGRRLSATFGQGGSILFEDLSIEKELRSLLVLPDLEDDEVLSPSLLLSFCRTLGIPPDDFGLDEEDL